MALKGGAAPLKEGGKEKEATLHGLAGFLCQHGTYSLWGLGITFPRLNVAHPRPGATLLLLDWTNSSGVAGH